MESCCNENDNCDIFDFSKIEDSIDDVGSKVDSIDTNISNINDTLTAMCEQMETANTHLEAIANYFIAAEKALLDSEQEEDEVAGETVIGSDVFHDHTKHPL